MLASKWAHAPLSSFPRKLSSSWKLKKFPTIHFFCNFETVQWHFLLSLLHSSYPSSSSQSPSKKQKQRAPTLWFPFCLFFFLRRHLTERVIRERTMWRCISRGLRLSSSKKTSIGNEPSLFRFLSTDSVIYSSPFRFPSISHPKSLKIFDRIRVSSAFFDTHFSFCSISIWVWLQLLIAGRRAIVLYRRRSHLRRCCGWSGWRGASSSNRIIRAWV